MAAPSFCPHCGTTAVPTTHTPGSVLIELALWLFFLAPGIIYSLWRLSARTRNTCPSCKTAGMIPMNSPQALMMRQQLQQMHAQHAAWQQQPAWQQPAAGVAPGR
jgi:hypothetical protein